MSPYILIFWSFISLVIMSYSAYISRSNPVFAERLSKYIVLITTFLIGFSLLFGVDGILVRQ